MDIREKNRLKSTNEDKRRQSFQRIYESSFHTGKEELNREHYLASLPKEDRNGILILINNLFPRLTRIGSYSLFAVGTTTFPEDYWKDLTAYLKNKDPKKLEFVNRHGENIDLQIVSEYGFLREPAISTAYEAIKDILKEKKFKFKLETDKSEGGTGYFHHREIPNDLSSRLIVERYKHIEYGSRKIKVYLPNSRSFHIFFDGSLATDEKLKVERTYERPFSLLFRHSYYSALNDAIYLINAYENQRNNLKQKD